MDRRVAERRQGERRNHTRNRSTERRAGGDRRKGERRQAPRPQRSINQYDMSEDELEFVNAIVRFRQQSGNRFPKARDILQILRDLGYEKRTDG